MWPIVNAVHVRPTDIMAMRRRAMDVFCPNMMVSNVAMASVKAAARVVQRGIIVFTLKRLIMVSIWLFRIWLRVDREIQYNGVRVR